MEKANQARELVESRGFGCLATLSVRQPGFPFVSIVEYATGAAGDPLFLLSGLAVHTKNLTAHPQVSLAVFAAEAEHDTLSTARVTLMGLVARLTGDDEVRGARQRYVARHPQSAQWMGFGDFAFHRLHVQDVYYVGGFGQMGWVSAADYASGMRS